MKRNINQPQSKSFVIRVFTIILCFTAGGFCLFKSGIGQSVEQPVVAASSPVSTAQAPSPTPEYKLKSVADFKVGDTIMAYNHETGQREQKIVKQTFQRQVDHLRILEVQGEDGSKQTIKTTDEHPFWVPSAGEYLEAKQLKPGTRLTGANGHFITVTSTHYEPHPEGVTVYNVEVEDFHNYFVAANGYRGPPVLAHNTCNSKKSLLPGELKSGTYGDLIKAGKKGDNITPHHLPSAKHMSNHNIAKRDGLALNMEHPYPGKGGRHRRTFTYGTNADEFLTPRNALGQGINDMRRIYIEDGLYNADVRKILQNYILRSKKVFPDLFQ